MLRITPVAEAVPPSPIPAAAAAEDTGGSAATTADIGPAEVAKVDVKVPVLATRKKHFHCGLFSVADPDPYVFMPPGSGSVSQMTDPDPDPSIIKPNSKKTIDSHFLLLLFDFLTLKNDVNVWYLPKVINIKTVFKKLVCWPLEGQ